MNRLRNQDGPAVSDQKPGVVTSLSGYVQLACRNCGRSEAECRSTPDGCVTNMSVGVEHGPHCETCTCGCTCGYGGEHLDNNPRCALNEEVNR
jgi:hypothetical protein